MAVFKVHIHCHWSAGAFQAYIEAGAGGTLLGWATPTNPAATQSLKCHGMKRGEGGSVLDGPVSV